MSTGLRIKPNARARIREGHPWVFANEVEQLLPRECDGEAVECRDRDGRFLGMGIYNGGSQIAWRRYSRERVPLEQGFMRAALERALARRDHKRSATENAAERLVWSESDDLPGVVADRYGDTLVVQILTLAMEKRTAWLEELLHELLEPEEIIFRNDSPIRKLEGLPEVVRTRSGRNWEPRWMRIDGIDYWLDLEHGQKTGFYLDQRQQHVAVAQRVASITAAGAGPVRVLDAFCNQGSFALHSARAGASNVLGLDSAADAIRQARANAERNGLKVGFEVANVFDWFTAQRDADPAWNMIILDPPPFAKSRSSLDRALRGYKELNLRAMKALVSGGYLATYSCSHHVGEAEFRQMLGEAAADAKRRVHVVEWCHQARDHPVLMTMPESEYLRGYILQVG